MPSNYLNGRKSDWTGSTNKQTPGSVPVGLNFGRLFILNF
jgi:hypothetical protein